MNKPSRTSSNQTRLAWYKHKAKENRKKATALARELRKITLENQQLKIALAKAKIKIIKLGNTRNYYDRFIKRNSFLRNANMSWMMDFEAFVRDVGERPGDDYELTLRPGCESWGEHTALWTRRSKK